MTQGLRIYLSGPDRTAGLAREAALELAKVGHEILSTWHNEDQADRGRLGSMELVPILLEDLQAVVQADLLVAFAQGGDRSRSLFELGVACHAGAHLHLIGRADQHGYDLLPTTTRWQTWPHFRRGSALWPDRTR